MLIEIHSIQNHTPANLNRDDLGAPKTCYFGGVLRSRISSQCIKRSIRMSDEFNKLCGGIRTRQLAKLIAEQVHENKASAKRARKILELCGFKSRATKGDANNDGADEAAATKMLIYTTQEAVHEMARLLRDKDAEYDENIAQEFADIISKSVAVPDMALAGRMLEPDKTAKIRWLDTTVEAALQVAHAISTHEARPEVDYYVAADDVPGDDAGAGFVDEAMFASACFYKYFSIHWETLVSNLKNFPGNVDSLAAHTVGAFIRAAVVANPSGKQNSFAAHNPPDGILIEIKNSPMSYANAFARPAAHGERDIISQSIAQLGQYVHDLDIGYGAPKDRFWFSPNQRYFLSWTEGKTEKQICDRNLGSLDELVAGVITVIGYDWEVVKQVSILQDLAS